MGWSCFKGTFLLGPRLAHTRAVVDPHASPQLRAWSGYGYVTLKS